MVSHSPKSLKDGSCLGSHVLSPSGRSTVRGMTEDLEHDRLFSDASACIHSWVRSHMAYMTNGFHYKTANLMYVWHFQKVVPVGAVSQVQ